MNLKRPNIERMNLERLNFKQLNLGQVNLEMLNLERTESRTTTKYQRGPEVERLNLEYDWAPPPPKLHEFLHMCKKPIIEKQDTGISDIVKYIHYYI